MKEKDWRNRKPFIENIKLIRKGINYASAIARARGFKDCSPVLKQLREMESLGLVTSKKTKHLNKTIFKINHKKVRL